jgi:peptidoglycan/xylan/chitin deacetylase (PgdA/CDA1 family)
MTKAIFCNYSICVDAVAGWLGSYNSWGTDTGSEDSGTDISRGLFAGHVGIPRLLKLFDTYELKTTWLIPGHSIETFPRESEMVATAGHEIGVHGYAHETPKDLTAEQEEAVLAKCVELVGKLCGRPPVGFDAPGGEFSASTVDLLLKYGFKYDHTLMENDFHCHYVRKGDSWTRIDFAKPAEEWMKPFVRGEETDLVEVPASWYLEDWPPFVFQKGTPNSHGFVNPRYFEQIWLDQFDWLYNEYDYAVFPISIHPDTSGHPHILLMQQRIIEHINSHPGVVWATMEEIADDFRERYPRRADSAAAEITAQ